MNFHDYPLFRLFYDRSAQAKRRWILENKNGLSLFTRYTQRVLHVLIITVVRNIVLLTRSRRLENCVSPTRVITHCYRVMQKKIWLKRLLIAVDFGVQNTIASCKPQWRRLRMFFRVSFDHHTRSFVVYLFFFLRLNIPPPIHDATAFIIISINAGYSINESKAAARLPQGPTGLNILTLHP